MIRSSPCGKIHTAAAQFRPRVLIVDDEPLVRWSLSSGLCVEGFDAVTASSGAEALTLAGRQPKPDVVLLDVRLYGADPRALLEELRLIAPRCRVLVLTTAGQELPLPRWDGVTVVGKPFDLAEVVRLVRAAAAA